MNRRQKAVSWPDVSRTLSNTETRSYAVKLLNECQKSDVFEGAKPATRRAWADALSKTEDWLKLQHRSVKRDAERKSLRAVRRRLECEIWP